MAAPKLIFMTPSHQHPTGRLMSLARRTEFLGMSRPGKTWIVEDDYDGEFHYDSRPVPALQGLDAHGRVFYVGTFSKAMTSDIRLGYLVVPPALVGTLEIAQRHIGLIASSHIQEALAEFIADGHFLAHLRRMRRLYHARRDHLVEGLERHLGEVLVRRSAVGRHPAGRPPQARSRRSGGGTTAGRGRRRNAGPVQPGARPSTRPWPAARLRGLARERDQRGGADDGVVLLEHDPEKCEAVF